MTLHNPHTVATPSQRLEEAAHQARLARMAARAKALVPALEPVVEIARDAEASFSFDDWVRRQERLNPIPREPWFSIVSESEPPRPSIESIQSKVAKYYGTTRHEMLSERRVRRLVIPRHVAMYFCRQLTLRSYPEIGRRFGNRDHTVPIYACTKIERLIQTDPKMAADVAAIKTLMASAS